MCDGDYVADGRIDIGQDVSGGDADDADAPAQEKCIACSIPLRPIAAIMRLAIDFGDQLSGGAVEVCNQPAERMLLSKLEPVRSSA